MTRTPGASQSSTVSIVMTDCEVIEILPEAFTYYSFNPNPLKKGTTATGCPRLANISKMYTKYRINSVRVKYRSTCSTTQTGMVVVAVHSGTANSAVKTATDALQVKPHLTLSPWEDGVLTIPNSVMAQRQLYSGDTTRDGVAFTVYASGPKDSGYLEVEYSVTLFDPIPFS